MPSGSPASTDERTSLLSNSVVPTGSDTASRSQPKHDEGDDIGRGRVEPSGWHTPGLLPKLGATMVDFFTTGCATAAVGALIPDIEQRYGTNDGTTALIFPAGMIGYVGATASVALIVLRHGRRGIAWTSPVVRLLAALLLISEPAFGMVLVGYICLGFGTGLTDTAWNTWASSTTRPNVIQGLLHGSFSLGCITGPLIADAVLKKRSWGGFYMAIALLSAVELCAQGWAFRHDMAVPRQQQEPHDNNEDDVAKPTSLLRNPTIWICGIFYFVYQGVEQTFTGWVVVFMLRVRGADSTTASLASSTFWIGMTLGRYALGLATERFGVATSVSVYITLALGFQVILNLDADINSTILLLGAIGVFAAPLFPSGIVLLVSRLTSKEHMSAVALLIALGQLGGALSNLAVGHMADSFGIEHLFQVMCGLTAIMLMVWMILVRVGEDKTSACTRPTSGG